MAALEDSIKEAKARLRRGDRDDGHRGQAEP
jgi:hypothetical protein